MEANNICDCGHDKRGHFNTEGACDKCACTWYHGRIINDTATADNDGMVGLSI